MIIIKPSFEILDDFNGAEIMAKIEKAGRTCYKSEDRITEDSAKSFVNMICNTHKHHSVIEHESISVRIICDRGVSHEIVRHRIASYSQESTRYVNYSKDKHGGELTFIEPCFWEFGSKAYMEWSFAMKSAEAFYLGMIQMGAKPEEARSVLPNSLKTEIVVTMNLRSWYHFFDMRTSKQAHPQIREIAIPLLEAFKNELPIIYGTLWEKVNA